MRTVLVFAAALLTGMSLTGSAARADIIEYHLGGTGGPRFILQGKATVNAGGTVTVDPANPQFEPLYFALTDVTIHPVDTTRVQFTKKLAAAKRKKDADECFAAGEWALKHGMLAGVYEAVELALTFNPQHERSLDVQSLQKRMQEPLGDSSTLEAEMRSFVKNNSMKAVTSNHYMMLHDTSDTAEKTANGRKLKTRSEKRLELLEQVYESFMLLFFSKGIDLEVPQQRLPVILFNDYDDYLRFSTGISPSLASAAGYWSPSNNMAVFFDFGSDEGFKQLQELSRDLNKTADELVAARLGGNSKDIIRLARSLAVLVKIEQENQDYEVVSHECTHQMAGNTGLFPRGVMTPSWIHEGLATYFEAPSDGAWAGIGAVNDLRLSYYNALSGEHEISNLNFIVGDQIFDYAGSHGSVLHAYGQAWAATHFLIEKHFVEFVAFYRALGEMPRHVQLNADILTRLFQAHLGQDIGALNNEWHSYMSGLKTDVQIALGEDD